MDKKRDEYGKFTVVKLKELLEAKKAKPSGKKAELIDRLIFYENNKDFGYDPDEDQLKERIKTPSLTEYKDLHAACPLPDFTEDDLLRFLERYEKNKDEADILYTKGYLLSIRFAQIGSAYFVKGRCDASRKKSVQYETDACFTMKGDVEGSSCECAAGWSIEAHCKHVIITLLALLDICTKKTVVLNETCTEKLQAFHRPSKKFFQSPQQAKQLMQRKRVRVKLFEQNEPSTPEPSTPHPSTSILNHQAFEMSEEYKVKWKERFINLLINNGCNSTMAIKMIVPPANIYGVALDHTYSTFNLITDVLEYLQLINLTPDDVSTIEEETRGQSHNYLWHWHRSHRMSASMFSRIFHVTDKGAAGVIDNILNPKPVFSKPIEHGRKYESTAVKAWNDRHSGHLELTQCGLFVHPDHPEICGTPDRLNSLLSVLEVKCPYNARNDFIDETTVPSLIPYLENSESGGWTLKTDSPYYYQVQGQLLVTGRSFCDFIVWTFKDLIQINSLNRFFLLNVYLL